MTIIIDTKEQINQHITNYFHLHHIPFLVQKLDIGDYSAFIPQNVELGIYRDTYFPLVIERKNGMDELVEFMKGEGLEKTLIRAQRVHFTLLVESAYENIVNGNYRSQYAPNALNARLKTFEARYGFATTFLSNQTCSGHFVYTHFYYHIRAMLKG